MKTFAILLLCISLLTLAAASHSIEPTKFSLAAETPDAAAHVDVKETIVPIKRQDAGLPPVCWNACLMGAVSEIASCESP